MVVGAYPLQSSIVYGPIRSRRLGNSLGINVLPTSYKMCDLNCVYCQYSWTAPTNGHREPAPSAQRILAETEQALQAFQQQGERIDCLTIAGNGEPTLHPGLEEVVVGLKALRDRYTSGAPVGILSDSTLCYRPKVRRALMALDARYMKLDAGTAAWFVKINGPLGEFDWSRMIEGLRTLPQIVLQSMFITGSVDNTQPGQIDQWIHAVQHIRPLSVQVYTVDRPTADQGIDKVPPDRLRAIAARLTERTGIAAEVFE